MLGVDNALGERSDKKANFRVDQCQGYQCGRQRLVPFPQTKKSATHATATEQEMIRPDTNRDAKAWFTELA